MVTIYDIAKRTGFSPPTVSKALNGRKGISECTKREIDEPAASMGYVPNQHAKALVTKRAWLIGVVYEENDLCLGIEHPLFSGVLNAFKLRVEEDGYEVLFLASKLGRKRLSLLDHCRYRGVSAVLVLNSMGGNPEILELLESGVICVSANVVFPSTTTVTSENVEPSMEAVRYLKALGHRRIGHLAGPLDRYASAGLERLEGYRLGLAREGLEADERLVAYAEKWNHESGYAAMKALLRNGADPTAVYVSSDILAFGAMEALREAGACVPEDVSLISFDDNEASHFLHPALTTFRQDRAAIGRTAAELLLGRIKGREAPLRMKIPVRLIERESCARAP